MAQFDIDKALALAGPIQQYAGTLGNADRIRVAALLLELANAVQQTAVISAEDFFHAKECTLLFNDVEKDDPMGAGFHLYCMLENLADEFNELADVMSVDEECV